MHTLDPCLGEWDAPVAKQVELESQVSPYQLHPVSALVVR
jgi:hypothetical protein